MSRNIDYIFTGENNDYNIGDIYSRIERLYKGIGKAIVDIYRDEVIALLPPTYTPETLDFLSSSLERYLIFGEVGAIGNTVVNDTEITRIVIDNEYTATYNGDKLNLFIIRKDTLFSEGINSERFGLSILTECQREIKRYNLALDSLTLSIKSNSIDVIKSELDTNDLLNSVSDTSKRIEEINRVKGVFSTIFLKDGEEFEVINKSLSNIDKAIEKIELALCSVSKVPYFRLFGKVSSSQRYSGVEEKKAFQKALSPLIRVSNEILKYYAKITKQEYTPIAINSIDIEREEATGKALDNLMMISELLEFSDEEKREYLKSRGIL